MKKQIQLLGLLLLSSSIISAQEETTNLVKNGGFEQVEGKLKKRGAIESSVGWISPTKTKADLFSPKGSEEISVPNNELGKEDALEGSNYAGIVGFSYNDKEPRTYLSTKLNETLKKGFKYCVTFNISLSEASKYASNNIGIHFSKRQFHFEEDDKSIMGETHIMDKDNKIFNARYNWDKVCGIYEAQGGEKFLNVGNFSSNKDTRYDRMKQDRNVRVRQIFSAYYYVDDVSVRLIEENSECECKSASSLEAYQSNVVYSRSFFNSEGMEDKDIVQARNIYFAFGKSKLEVTAKSDLDSLVLMMKENPSYKIKVKGHHEKMETEASKIDGKLNNMSTKRIDEVIEYFAEKGISKDRLTKKDFADENPASPGKSEFSRAKNRRVEFELIQ